MIYLDNNATTQPSEAVVTAMQQALTECWANPSSVHQAGLHARHFVDHAREQVARLVGCSAREIIFTSGGTESCNLALAGSIGELGRRAIATTRFEHSAIRECAEALASRGTEVVWIEGGVDGVIDPTSLERLLKSRASEISVVSIMWANNETGVVQPIEQLSSICRQYQVRFHTDATQWVGRMPTNMSDSEIDLMTFSAHKLHGPKGSGALFCRRGVTLCPMIVGGAQERDRRGGTENVAGIVGFGVAADQAREWHDSSRQCCKRCEALRDHFEGLVCAGLPTAIVLGHTAPRIWSTSCIAFPNLQAEAVVIELSSRGLAASAGAACSSGSLDPSPVLLAMGIAPEIAHGAVRFSISRNTTESEITDGASVVIEAVQKLSRSMP